MDTNKKEELKRGVLVFVALAVLTVVEFFLGVNEVAAIFLWIVALLKGGLVLVYFMHISRVFRSEGGH
ncbi:MAG: cytochrome C oxidase subunit IV family protein [Bellilinea sp.]|jgi:cytochrome c oxidase subunit 4